MPAEAPTGKPTLLGCVNLIVLEWQARHGLTGERWVEAGDELVARLGELLEGLD